MIQFSQIPTSLPFALRAWIYLGMRIFRFYGVNFGCKGPADDQNNLTTNDLIHIAFHFVPPQYAKEQETNVQQSNAERSIDPSELLHQEEQSDQQQQGDGLSQVS